MKYLNSLLAGLVFLHALITAPLLVECISVDGRYLFEILGQDPCHDSFGNRPLLERIVGSTDARTTVYRGDPCVDLILASPVGMQTCDDSLTPQLQASSSPTLPQDSESDITLASDHLEPAGRFLHVPDFEPKLRLTLRI